MSCNRPGKRGGRVVTGVVLAKLEGMRGTDLLLRDSENMITVQEDRTTFVCSTRIHNGEPSARTSCRARVRPDSA